jgi:hypothetical protein
MAMIKGRFNCRVSIVARPVAVSPNRRALPAEVVVPQVAPRMEEGGVLTSRWIDGGLTGGLA